MDLREGGGVPLGEEGGKIVVRMCCMTEESIFNKNKKKRKRKNKIVIHCMFFIYVITYFIKYILQIKRQ